MAATDVYLSTRVRLVERMDGKRSSEIEVNPDILTLRRRTFCHKNNIVRSLTRSAFTSNPNPEEFFLVLVSPKVHR